MDVFETDDAVSISIAEHESDAISKIDYRKIIKSIENNEMTEAKCEHMEIAKSK